ncbi:apolipoprotein acyltransferase [Pseudoprimorskyibacter insulae]|uniref:Apolipoprotein acyltransferase n=1 Tax=Pseudoprimorskyibacter insulae TaxID=1695997 RepID=A0A2R8AW98_9RHOB|nr:apolipoprotein acyltransferase [Pseudoprimorskyibacter insulae]SPF80321.1 hypothetical protein PRI8871_02124 [Pseudoprimorskyibacter insulae]
MIVIILTLLGVTVGALTAKRRKGKPLDMAQYAAGYGILFALMGLIITIAVEKSL